MEWQFATQTHPGNVRSVNEDALLIAEDYPLMVVADGMGGHEAGDVASGMIVDRLAQLDLDAALEQEHVLLEAALLDTNARILDFASTELRGGTMGSTVVAMLSQDTRGVCLWAGDSRLYRFRAGVLELLTEDHSYVSDLVKAGALGPEAAKNHPAASVITRAIGGRDKLVVDTLWFDVHSGDRFMLCSDGLYNEIDDTELAEVLADDDIDRSAAELLELCLSRAARDNVTLVLAQARERHNR